MHPCEAHWLPPSAGAQTFPSSHQRLVWMELALRNKKVGNEKAIKILRKPTLKLCNLVGLGPWILQSCGHGRKFWGAESWGECSCCVSQCFTPPCTRSIIQGLCHGILQGLHCRWVYIPLHWPGAWPCMDRSLHTFQKVYPGTLKLSFQAIPF